MEIVHTKDCLKYLPSKLGVAGLSPVFRSLKTKHLRKIVSVSFFYRDVFVTKRYLKTPSLFSFN